jgi:hypothetical protein
MNPDMYIAGPMRGIPEENRPAFAAAEEALKAAHFVPYNPAAPDNQTEGWTFLDYMKFDIPKLIECGRIFTLPNWRDSEGALMEMYVAMKLQLPWYKQDSEGRGYKVDNESALLEAHDLVYGGRGVDYGHPHENYSKTAAIWQVLFGKKLKLGAKVGPEDVMLGMIAVKMSRELNRPKRDNRVDGAGYFELLERCAWLTDEKKNEIKQGLGLD